MSDKIQDKISKCCQARAIEDFKVVNGEPVAIYTCLKCELDCEVVKVNEEMDDNVDDISDHIRYPENIPFGVNSDNL